MTLLKCSVRKGMFSDESVVEIRTADGKDLSFFVPVEKVRQGGKVEVRVVRKGGKIWATLPTADPQNAILVHTTDLVEESA